MLPRRCMTGSSSGPPRSFGRSCRSRPSRPARRCRLGGAVDRDMFRESGASAVITAIKTRVQSGRRADTWTRPSFFWPAMSRRANLWLAVLPSRERGRLRLRRPGPRRPKVRGGRGPKSAPSCHEVESAAVEAEEALEAVTEVVSLRHWRRHSEPEVEDEGEPEVAESGRGRG